MPTRAPKRAKIEARLGQSLRSFLKEKLAEGLSPGCIAREIKLDPATVRYYVKKFKLPYQLKVECRGSKFRNTHLDICLCPRCDIRPVRCEETRGSHKLKRCIWACVNFKARGKT